MTIHVPALNRSLSDVVAEYDLKVSQIEKTIADYADAGATLVAACTVGGTYGRTSIDTSGPYEWSIQASLIKSAWWHVYEGLCINILATAKERRVFEQQMETPPPFTLDNIRATFGKYVADPRGNILRGLAETFCDLDQAYRSHEKMKIGVAGLPKQIVLTGFGGHGSWGRERLVDVLNALAKYRNQPLVEGIAMRPIDDLHSYVRKTSGQVEICGLTIKKFMNSNVHLMFDKAALLDINRALAEFYGEVLPDCPEERPERTSTGTAVAKDLQFYWTSAKTLERVMTDAFVKKGSRWLEPSCGDGRMLDVLRSEGAKCLGIEVDPSRAAEARAKGHSVLCANFLETEPTGDFDGALMNPPFYGKHYAKHVRHALRFLKPGGRLVAILPASARYDHGLLDDLGGRWDDLPVGSFSESGTNINTVVLTVYARGG